MVASAVALLVAWGVAGGEPDLTHPPSIAPRHPTEVLLLPGAPERQEVLVPTDLLRQLDALSGGSGATPHGAVLVSATYSGKAGEGRADFEGIFQVHNFEARAVTLPLPFGGIRVQEEALLDDAPAYLTAAQPPQSGYLLRIEKPGTHVLRLRFQVPVRSNGDERELSFTVPRVVQSRIPALDLPPNATTFQALIKQGEVELLDSGSYRIELGRPMAPLQFLWRCPTNMEAAPEVRVREAYLWDLGPDFAHLDAVLHGTVVRGAISSLTLHVPPLLEVQTVTTGAGTSGRRAPFLKEWKIEGSDPQRRLVLDFLGPVLGDFHVLLDFVPCRPLGKPVTLTVPEPLGVQFERGFLSYRTHGLECRLTNRGWLGNFQRKRDNAVLQSLLALGQATADTTSGRVRPISEAKSEYPTAPVYVLQRNQKGSPFLQLQLSLAPGQAECSQDIHWRLGNFQADLRLVARATTPTDGLTLLEWEVPENVTITHVGTRDGRDLVRTWTRWGRRLQVWLHRPVPEVELEVMGWKNLVVDNQGSRFDLPHLRPLSPAAGRSWLRLTIANDLTLEPMTTSGLLALPYSGGPGREMTYLVRESSYGGRFRVRPAASDLAARILTVVEVRDRHLVFTARAEYRARWGELRNLPLCLSNWEGGDVRLEARPATQRRELRRGTGERQWMLELPPGLTEPYSLSLTGSLPVEDSALRLAMPEVNAPGVGHKEQWLVVSQDLTTEMPQHLLAVAPDTPAWRQVQQTWPDELKRLPPGFKLWKVERDGWNLHLLPRQRFAEAGAVRILLTERRAAVVENSHWAHEAVYWLAHEANTALNISLPANARILSLALDGVSITPVQVVPDSLWLPLPGRAGVLGLRLCWAFEPGTESFERPNLEGPTFRSIQEGPTLWTVHVPFGWRAKPTSSPFAQAALPASAVAWDLARAEGQYHLAVALLAQAQDGLPLSSRMTAIQRRFFQFCRYAECGIAAAPTNVQGQSLEAWLQSLQEKNAELTRTHGLEEVRLEAERRIRGSLPASSEEDLSDLAGGGILQTAGPRGDLLPFRGTPLRWQMPPEAPAPVVSLQSLEDVQRPWALGASFLLILLLLFVWTLARFPTVHAWFRAFWPEQAIVLGCAGWLALGRPWWMLILAGVGVLARGVFLGRRGLALLHRAEAATKSGSSVIRAPRSSVLRT